MTGPTLALLFFLLFSQSLVPYFFHSFFLRSPLLVIAGQMGNNLSFSSSGKKKLPSPSWVKQRALVREALLGSGEGQSGGGGSGMFEDLLHLVDEYLGVWYDGHSTALKGNSGDVNALSVLSDGRLASGSLDSTVHIWSLSSGACLQTLQGHTDPVYTVRVERRSAGLGLI